MARRGKPLIDLELELQHQTEAAYLVSDGRNPVWIPKSRCQIEFTGKGKMYTVTLDEDLAIEKGLV